MKFNYFRIFVTVLASFAAFFAYVCRLNLSLSLCDMTVKRGEETSSTPAQASQQGLASSPPRPIERDERGLLNYKLPPIYNEEHSFAWMSRGISGKIPQASSVRQVELGARNKSILLRGLEVGTQLVSFAVDEKLDKPKTTGANGNRQPAATSDGGESSPQQPQQQQQQQSNKLDWSEPDKNDVLGAFFYGYVFFQIPSARAAEIFGAKLLLLMCCIVTGVCSIVFPLAAKLPEGGLLAAQLVRLIMGASQGALFPVAYVFLCEWLPKNERSTWLPFPSAFSRIGTILMNLVVPIIINNYGWEMVFYVSGALTLTWSVIFIIFGSDSPAQSYWISKDELVYIESHMEPRIGTLNKQSDVSASGFTINEPAPCGPGDQQSSSPSKPSINWWKIMTNKAIFILAVVMFLSDWSNFILLIKLPGFLEPVFKMDTAEVGLWSSVLVAIFFVLYPLSGFCASKLEESFDSLSSIQVRKIFEVVAHSLQAAGCVIIATCDQKTVVIVALCMMMVGRSIVGGSQCLMPPELSKDYPGTVFAYCNTIANLSGIIGPKATTWLVSDPSRHESWFGLFMVSAVMFAVGGLIFCLFADNQCQDISRAPKLSKKLALSQAQLTIKDSPAQRAAEIFKMDAFPRVSSEPDPSRTVGGTGTSASAIQTAKK